MAMRGILAGAALATTAIAVPTAGQAATPPDAPSITAVERAGAGSAKVSFALAKSGPDATSVHVTAHPGGKWCTAHMPARTCTVNGLKNGKVYSFTAIASAKGNSSASEESEPLLVARRPFRPLKAVASVQLGGKATLSWTTGDDGGLPITGYRVSSPAGAGCTTDASTTSCSITNLTPGTHYLFSVVAINDAGASNPTAANRVTARDGGRPGEPTVTRVEVIADGIVRVWAKPGLTNGGGTPGITVWPSLSPNGARLARSCVVTGPEEERSCTINVLHTGVTLYFTAMAQNRFGQSQWSPGTLPTLVAWLPSRPRNVTPTPQAGGTAEVTWSKPWYDGGLPITGYTATATPGGATCSAVTEMRCTLTGLEPGVKYDVTMTATNAWGTSPTTQPARVVVQ